MKSSNPERHTI